MRSLVFNEVKQPLELMTVDPPVPGPSQAIVRLEAAALNRRDYWISQGQYPGIRTPVILGSDGAGTVTEVGAETDDSWVGREVVIYPGTGWGDNPKAQSKDFCALGMPDNGTLATEIVVEAECLFPKPEHLNWEQAAALPLAGVTAYRALFTQGQCREGDKVLVHGVGGGVACLALQMAIAAGADVLVTSSSQSKIDQAISLGARAGYSYREEDWWKRILADEESIDLVIDGAAGKDYTRFIQLATPGGRIVNYGATAGKPPEIDMYRMFWKQLHLIGASMGSPQDFQSLLDFSTRTGFAPRVDQVFPLHRGNEALEHMGQSKQFGKIVVDVSSID